MNDLREDIHCRLIAFVDEVDGRILSTSPVSVTIATMPMGRYFNRTMTGLNCSVSSWRRISDNTLPPRLKCPANYNNSRLAGIQAKIDGYDAVVLLDEDGKVTEGEGYNLFMIRNGVIVTPPVTYSILEGVTRSTLLRLFEDHLKVRVVERAIDRTELYIAEEIFVCGSGAEVVPIISVDRHSIGNGVIGAITRKIQESYFELVRGRLSGYEEWLLPIYK